MINRLIQYSLIIGILICCKSNYDYKNTNAGKDTAIVIQKDTFPSLARLINIYLKQNIDTSRVLLPNSKKALRFARSILDTTYGKELMDSEEPFEIELIDNKFWHLLGHLESKPGYITCGGVAEIMISKYDCRILYLTHGK
jgi:NTF2 fold immunity protein